MKENLRLKKESQYLERTNVEFEATNTQLKNSLSQLREFTSALIKDVQMSKQRENRHSKLFQTLEIDHFLFESEPPLE